jgi:exodeoxyribonuclease VII large subunit
VGELAGHLRALSPQRTLDRGYSIAQLPDGRVVRAATEAKPGERLTLTLAEGSLATTVDSDQDGRI